MLFIGIIFGSRNINPAYTGWVESGGGDYFQHYIGWQFFRNADWSRHFLFMRNLNFPSGTSVIVTDSNPLFCLIFKLFRDGLGESFQFNGLWLVFSYGLIGLSAAICGYHLTRSVPLTVMAVFLACMNPATLQRALIHDTLTAHWLILIALILLINDSNRFNWLGWGLLCAVAMLIHIYFLPMIAFILILQIAWMIFQRRDVKRILMICAAFALSGVILYKVGGYCYISGQSGSYGELSMNLNAFINPDGASKLLKSRATLPLQYEGFNYLGAGVLLFILCGAALIASEKKFDARKCLALISLAVPYLLLSISNVGVWDDKILWHIQLPDRLAGILSIFRSSGRLAWPFYYLLLFGTAYGVSRLEKKKRRVGATLLFICLFLQAYDLSGFYAMAYARFHAAPRLNPETQRLNDALPESLLSGKTIMIISDGDAKTKDALALMAAKRKMAFNQSANARGIKPIFGEDQSDFQTLLPKCASEKVLCLIIDERYLKDAESLQLRQEKIGDQLWLVKRQN